MLRQARTPVFMRLFDDCLGCLTTSIYKREIIHTAICHPSYVHGLGDLPFSLRHLRHPVFMRVIAEAAPEALLRRALYLRQQP